MHRRQGDLLEIHPCVLQDLPKTFQLHSRHSRHSSLSRHSSHSRHSSLSRHSSCSRHSSHSRYSVIQDIPVIHDIPAYPGNSTSSSISRESTPFQHSPIRMHILHILQFYRLVSTETPPSTSWTIQTTNITFFKEREMLRYRSI